MATLERGLRPGSIQEKKSGINKKFAVLALTGAVALGGIGFFASQQGEQTTPEPTPISGGVGNPNETNNPIITSNPEATPSETENNQENDMSKFAINTWLDMLSSQQYSKVNERYLDFNINNKEEWQKFMDRINNSGVQAESLKITWLGGFMTASPIEDGKFQGHKMSGDAEFNNVTLSIDEQEITSADQANGYTFKGLVKITYAERYSNNFYEPAGQEDVGEKDSVLDWIHQPEEKEASFTEWEDGSVKFPIAMVNGEWKAKLDNLFQESFGTPNEDYNGFLIPFKSFYSTYCGEGQSDCKVIHKDLPY